MQEIILPTDHILYTSAKEIEAICEPLFKHFHCYYFSFLRLFANGERAHLSTHPEVQELFYKRFYVYLEQDHFINQIDFYTSGYVRWKDLDFRLVYHDYATYGIGNGITIIDKQVDYVDLFCFGSGAMYDPGAQEFIANIDLLQQFIGYFKQRAADLIVQAEEQRIPTRLTNHKKSFFDFRQIYAGIPDIDRREFIDAITIKTDKINITVRERECIECLVKGKSSKEIAQELGISSRTVERHLENIKQKFSCNKITQLLTKVTELRILP